MENQNSLPGNFSKSQNRTLRLTFSYERDNVEFVSQQSIEMLPPPPAPVPIQKGQSGFWYELQDKSAQILYQRSIYNPIQFEMTAHSKEPEKSMKKVQIEEPQGIFELLAPDLDETQTIVLFSSPLDPNLSADPATELARFELKSGSQEEEVIS